MFKILSLYFIKKFIKILLSLSLGLIFIIFISNFLTNIKALTPSNVSNLDLIVSSIQEIPYFFQLTLPFVVLVSALFFIRNISNTNEFDIIRSSGICIWQIILIITPILFIVGCLVIFIIAPLNSVLKLEHNSADDFSSSITTSNDSFWIIDKQSNINQIIIKAKKAFVTDNIIHLTDLIVFQIVNGKFNLRVDGKEGFINQGQLIINDAQIKDTNTMFPTQLNSFTIKTNLKPKNLQNLILEPEMIKIWELPTFIKNLKQLGLNTNTYKVYFYNLLTYPLMLLVMFILGVGLSLSREKRISGTKVLIIGIIAGFLLHFFMDLINAFGASGLVPPLLTVTSEITLMACLGSYLIVIREGL